MFFNPNTCGKWLLNCRRGRRTIESGCTPRFSVSYGHSTMFSVRCHRGAKRMLHIVHDSYVIRIFRWCVLFCSYRRICDNGVITSVGRRWPRVDVISSWKSGEMPLQEGPRQNGGWFSRRLIIFERNDCAACPRKLTSLSPLLSSPFAAERSSAELYYKTNIFQVLWGITIVFWKGLPARAARRNGSRGETSIFGDHNDTDWYIISYNFYSGFCLLRDRKKGGKKARGGRDIGVEKRKKMETWLRIPSARSLARAFAFQGTREPRCSALRSEMNVRRCGDLIIKLRTDIFISLFPPLFKDRAKVWPCSASHKLTRRYIEIETRRTRWRPHGRIVQINSFGTAGSEREVLAAGRGTGSQIYR